MTTVDVINAMEVVWWPVCGIAIISRSLRATADWRWLGFIAGITLVAFGGSDAVELWTQAWWRPWWLLIWKSVCIAVLFACVGIRARKLKQPSQGD